MKRFAHSLMLLIVASLFAIPFYWLLLTSFKSSQQLASNPAAWVPAWPNASGVLEPAVKWDHYAEALRYLPPETRSGLTGLAVSLLVAALAVVGTLLASSTAAYAFARLRFRGRDGLFAIVVATLMLPGAATLVPQFMLYRSLGLYNRIEALWAPAFFGSALAIFLLRQFMLTLPQDLDDAAEIDGAGAWRRYWSIALPQIRPALVVVGFGAGLASWGNILGPLIYIASPERMPLPYLLQQLGTDHGREPGVLAAAAVMALIPALLAFLLVQRPLLSEGKSSIRL